MRTIKRIQFFFLTTLAIMLVSCADQKTENEAQIITVSISPQKYFVEALIGDKATINVMVPNGGSPASYEPSPKQMKNLSNSDLYLSIGHLGFEKAWLPRFEKGNPELKIIDLSQSIDLIEDSHSEDEEVDEGGHHHHGTDPHYWMSPKQARKMLAAISSTLIMHDNTCKDLINKNRDSLDLVISKLDQEFETELKQLKNRKFIIFHPALSYLARDYNLEQIPMEFEGKEPSPSHLKKIVDRARDENIRMLFIQKEFDIENAKQLANEIDADLLQIDPLSVKWFEQMQDILEKLKKLDNN